jgi:hypothetical protein
MIGEGENMERINFMLNSHHFKNQQSSLDNHQSVPNPVAYAHRQRCAALWAKTQQPGSLKTLGTVPGFSSGWIVHHQRTLASISGLNL